MTATVVTSENLAEFQQSRMGLSVPAEASQEEPVVEQKENSDEIAEEADPQEKQNDITDEKKPVNPKLDKRFSELTKQREDARREAQVLRDELDTLKKQSEPKAPEVKADSKPTPQQFTDAFEYAEALAEWSAENALKTRDKQEVERKQKEARTEVVKAWETRQTAAKSELADYEDIVSSSSITVSDQVRDAILESDIGPKILYHLAKNPDFAESLANKSVVSAVREIGKLEAKLSGEKSFEKPVSTLSRAASPISPIRAAKAVDSPIDSNGDFHGSYASWKEARRAGKIK